MSVDLTLAHSPDPDDAFMWWPLARRDGQAAAINTGAFRFELVMDDIETLNADAEDRRWDITAISIAQYPRVARKYALTACGASIGDGYGPQLVACAGRTLADLLASGGPIAVPGERTTALATLRLLAGEAPLHWVVEPFDRIIDLVADGTYEAGLVIHEGQLTHHEAGLETLLDLGAAWKERTGLVLPLGGNAIARDLDARHGQGTTVAVTALLRQSIDWAMAHRDESIAYASQFARGLDAAGTDRFVAMYVNRWTLDFGEDGIAAVDRLLADAAAAGILPCVDGVVVA